jgi:hypothetical protein
MSLILAGSISLDSTFKQWRIFFTAAEKFKIAYNTVVDFLSVTHYYTQCIYLKQNVMVTSLPFVTASVRM